MITYGDELKILIDKLKERGVISNRRAKILRRLAKLLDSPVGKAFRRILVKFIVEILLKVLNDQ